MNWNKLPKHRRKALLLKWLREDIRDFTSFEHIACPDWSFRLDDNNLQFPVVH